MSAENKKALRFYYIVGDRSNAWIHACRNGVWFCLNPENVSEGWHRRKIEPIGRQMEQKEVTKMRLPRLPKVETQKARYPWLERWLKYNLRVARSGLIRACSGPDKTRTAKAAVKLATLVSLRKAYNKHLEAASVIGSRKSDSASVKS